MELSDGNTEESNRMLIGLDTIPIILKTGYQDLLNPINLEIKWANKKKKKVKRRW